MKQEKRIVTWMGYPQWIGKNPQEILSQGSRVLTLADKVRLYAVRNVVFNDSGKALHTTFERNEQPVTSPQGLKNMVEEGTPILDNDHSLKIYRNEIRNN